MDGCVRQRRKTNHPNRGLLYSVLFQSFRSVSLHGYGSLRCLLTGGDARAHDTQHNGRERASERTNEPKYRAHLSLSFDG
mmetsp:Transcript_4823/g.13962  ORF Transcript_4823/g.13962 Transcript_4823/m.13962 type:complete len:80 (+) Transcript_4823:766-1005(+)